MTDEPVLFWPVRGQYMAIYPSDTAPLKIVRILQGARNASAQLYCLVAPGHPGLHPRIGAVVILFKEKGGKEKEIPIHHKLEEWRAHGL